MKKVILILVLLLAGCGNPTPKVTPESLPSAIMGQPYSERVYISGGALRKGSVSIRFTPEYSGLTWEPAISYLDWDGQKYKREDFHNITISGTPISKGIISIRVSGSTLGTMFPGKQFSKTYEITVEE